MKKQLLIFLCISTMTLMSFAQISTKQAPRSLKMDVKIETINSITLASPDVDALIAEDESKAESSLFKMQRCAVLLPVGESLLDKATKISTQDADVYLLSIKSKGALAMNYYSDDFFIPKGGELYIYNKDKSKCLGAFTSDNNSEDGYFATDYVYSDEMIMEYYQPKSVKERAHLNIECVSYFYRDVLDFEELSKAEDLKTSDEYRSSGTCNVNVNCSEGDNYRKIQRAVVRLYIRMSYYEAGWCSGTIINNTANDRTPYLFSAAHCVENLSNNSSYYSQMIIYFNYENSGCSRNVSEPGYNSLTGVTHIAHDSKYAIGGTDYLLLKLKNTIPQSYNPYWAGWTISSTASTSGVGIHHPSGDVKKISTYTSQLRSISSSSYSQTTHWRVKWAQTANGFGITEGGSSGSGLFTSDGLLVGSLSGGYSSCEVEDDSKLDWYGKFYKSYDSISQYINPANSSLTFMRGRDYVDSVSSIENVESMNIESIFPNPASDNINIEFQSMKDNAVISMLDNLGRSLSSKEINAGENRVSLDVSSFAKGIYFVRIYSKSNSIVKQFIKN